MSARKVKKNGKFMTIFYSDDILEIIGKTRKLKGLSSDAETVRQSIYGYYEKLSNSRRGV